MGNQRKTAFFFAGLDLFLFLEALIRLQPQFSQVVENSFFFLWKQSRWWWNLEISHSILRDLCKTLHHHLFWFSSKLFPQQSPLFALSLWLKAPKTFFQVSWEFWSFRFVWCWNQHFHHFHDRSWWLKRGLVKYEVLWWWVPRIYVAYMRII